jgi:hypothetical protein
MGSGMCLDVSTFTGFDHKYQSLWGVCFLTNAHADGSPIAHFERAGPLLAYKRNVLVRKNSTASVTYFRPWGD